MYFLLTLWEGAHNTALDDRPEAFDGVGVDSADNVFPGGVVNSDVRIALLAQVVIANPLVSAEQADFVRNSLIDESLKGRGFDVGDHASDDVALALHRTDNDRGLATRRGAGQSITLIGVLVLCLAANECFIDLDNAAQLGLWFDQGSTNFVAHGMRRAVAAEAHNTLDLEGADALLAGQHQVNDTKPFPQRLIRIFEDRPCDVREAVGGFWRAFVALPAVAARQLSDFRIATARTFDATGPTARDQVRLASLFIGKGLFKLPDGHLMHWF